MREVTTEVIKTPPIILPIVSYYINGGESTNILIYERVEEESVDSISHSYSKIFRRVTYYTGTYKTLGYKGTPSGEATIKLYPEEIQLICPLRLEAVVTKSLEDDSEDMVFPLNYFKDYENGDKILVRYLNEDASSYFEVREVVGPTTLLHAAQASGYEYSTKDLRKDT